MPIEDALLMSKQSIETLVQLATRGGGNPGRVRARNNIDSGGGVAIGVVQKVTRATVLLNKYTMLLSFCRDLVGDKHFCYQHRPSKCMLIKLSRDELGVCDYDYLLNTVI